MTRSILRSISALVCTPTMRSISRPRSNTSRVGRLLISKRAAVDGFSSTLSFPTRSRPAFSIAISSIISAII